MQLKVKNPKSLTFNSVNLTTVSPVTNLNSVNIFILKGSYRQMTCSIVWSKEIDTHIPWYIKLVFGIFGQYELWHLHPPGLDLGHI